MLMSLSSTSVKNKKNLLEAVVFYKCHCKHYVKGLLLQYIHFSSCIHSNPLINNDQLVMFNRKTSADLCEMTFRS